MNQYGAKKDKADRRDFHLAGITAPIDLPKGFRIKDPFPVKNQNGFGSCTGQATAGHKQLQEGVELSARFAYAMTKKLEGNKEWGAYTRNQFKVLKEVGSVPEGAWSEKHNIPELEYLDWSIIPSFVIDDAKLHKSRTYWRVENIKQTIFQYNQAVVISVPWYTSYNKPKDGYLVLDKGWKYGHAVLVVGWKDDYYIVKNSWGKEWGANGMCYFHKDFPIWDAWVSLDVKDNLSVDVRYGYPKNIGMEKITAFNPWLIKKIGRLPNNREINGLWYGKWDFQAIFRGRVGDSWLHETKISYDI